MIRAIYHFPASASISSLSFILPIPVYELRNHGWYTIGRCYTPDLHSILTKESPLGDAARVN